MFPKCSIEIYGWECWECNEKAHPWRATPGHPWRGEKVSSGYVVEFPSSSLLHDFILKHREDRILSVDCIESSGGIKIQGAFWEDWD